MSLSDAAVSIFRRIWRGSAAVMLMGGALGLSGCLPAATQEDLSRDWDKGLSQWENMDWTGMGNHLIGADLSADGNLYHPAGADRTLCLNHNSEEREIFEEGSSDHINYRRCPVSPYPTRSLGERLSPGHLNPIEN